MNLYIDSFYDLQEKDMNQCNSLLCRSLSLRYDQKYDKVVFDRLYNMFSNDDNVTIVIGNIE